MQQARNVISFLLFFVLFNAKSAISQEIKGSYYRDYALKNFSSCLNFKKNNEFKYEYSGDLGLIEYGEGSYFIKKDSLFLNFNKSKPLALNYHRLYTWQTRSKDSIQLKFRVKTFKGETFPYSFVVVSSDNKDKKYRCDANGELFLKLEKKNTEINITVRNIGFSYNYKIYPLYNYETIIFINENQSSPIIGEIWKYKILEINEKYLNIKNGVVSKWSKKNFKLDK